MWLWSQITPSASSMRPRRNPWAAVLAAKVASREKPEDSCTLTFTVWNGSTMSTETGPTVVVWGSPS